MRDKAVNQTRNNKVRQSGRVVTAARRQTAAQEKARITGKKTRRPSAVEQSAVEWQKEQETRARKAQEAKLRTFRQAKEHPFSPQPMSFQADETQLPEDNVGWKPYDQEAAQRGNKERKGDAGERDVARPNTVTLFVLSRRMMAVEKGSALGRKPADPRSWALELEARRWAEGSARRRNK